MEESEKRRERLRAMRMEASSQVNSSPNSESDPIPSVLSNPLIETPSLEPCAAPRFDFYTDPMAAFSANKRPGSVSNTPNKRPSGISNQNLHDGFQPGGDGSGNTTVRLPPPPLGPRYPVNSPYPHQLHSHTMNTGTDQPGYHSVRSPSTMMDPYPIHQGPGQYNAPFPYHLPRAFNYPVSNPRGPSPPSPRQGQGLTPSPNPVGRGRGQWVDHRGGGHQRGRGYHPVRSPSTLMDPYPIHQGPGQYNAPFPYQSSRRLYDKSMVDDPWKDLEPVVWKGTNSWGKAPVAFQRYSSVSKKPMVVEASNTSKQSLADYLASAFDDALEETGTGGDAVA